MDEHPVKFRAFISYSRVDRQHAISLQSRLEHFILPIALRAVSPGVKITPRPLRPIFRDEDELVPGQSLPDRIREGLVQSEYLIVLCSPAAAKSEWVAKEILTFSAFHGSENILAVVVDGEPDAEGRGLGAALESLPVPLRYELDIVAGETNAKRIAVVSNRKAEPLWVDWRGHAASDRQSFLRLVAALLSLSSLDDLVERDIAFRRRQRIMRWAIAIAVLAGLMLAGLLAAWQARKGAMARSETLTNLAEKALEGGDMESAARYALLALRDADRWLIGFDETSAETALARAMLFNKRIGPATRIGSPDWSYALSRNGRIAAALLPDGSIRLWDAVQARPLGEIRSRKGAAAFELTVDGMRLALIYPGQEYRVEIWDVRTCRWIRSLSPEASVNAGDMAFGSAPASPKVAFSPDGRLFAAGSELGIDLWDVASGHRIASVKDAESSGYTSLAFSDSGTRLAATGVNKPARVYSLPGLVPLGHDLGPADVDSTMLAFGSDDLFSIGGRTGEFIEYRNLAGEPQRERQQLSDGAIASVSPDGMIEFESGAVLVWQGRYPVFDDPRPIKLFPAGMPARLADRHTVVTLSKGELRKWQLFNEPARIPLVGLSTQPGALTALPTRGDTLVVIDNLGAMALFDSDSLRRRRAISLPPRARRLTEPKLAASDDGSVIALAGEEGAWAVGRDGKIVSLSTVPVAEHAVAVSPDGRQIAFAATSRSGQSSLTFWDGAKPGHGERRISLGAKASDVAYTPDGAHLVVSLGETRPLIVDASTGTKHPAPFPPLYQARFSRDGSAVVDGDTSEAINVFDMRTGKPLRNFARWRYQRPDENSLILRWARGYSLWDSVDQYWMLTDRAPDGGAPLLLDWWVGSDQRHVFALGDGVVYRWPIGSALALHGQGLAEEACRTIVLGKLSRLSEREIAASPELNPDSDRDACLSVRR